MDIQKITESPWFTRALIAIGLVLIVLVVFQAGVYIGVRKAGLSFRMGDDYYRALGPETYRRISGRRAFGIEWRVRKDTERQSAHVHRGGQQGGKSHPSQ